ncbi:transposase family protein [Streptomyces sp. NPDC052013]|uniref:transposase family protein n=1 Tax=Streptomyces sp. NPDC052013 TaxID=3365679 RepID=UPI0037CE7445
MLGGGHGRGCTVGCSLYGDLPHALVEWVTMLIVTREGDRRCKLRPSQRAVITPVYLREHTTHAKLAAGFWISEGTAHAYVPSVINILASKAPSLTQACAARPEFVLVDGTTAECDRVGDHERDYSGKARRHGVNIQAVTDPAGELIWYSPALPGHTVDITAARTHHIVTTCEPLRIPALADKAYTEAGGTFQVPCNRHLGRPLTTRQAAVNRAHAPLRCPVERAFARLKARRIFRKARISPNRLTSIAKAVLTLGTVRKTV